MPPATILPQRLRRLQKQLQQKRKPATAHAILQEYLACYCPQDARQELWTLLVGCLSSDEMQPTRGRQRHNLFFFYEFTCLLLEAVAVAEGVRR